ncbi:unnamed protein product [Camellia sinensis]
MFVVQVLLSPPSVQRVLFVVVSYWRRTTTPPDTRVQVCFVCLISGHLSLEEDDHSACHSDAGLSYMLLVPLHLHVSTLCSYRGRGAELFVSSGPKKDLQ